LRPTSRLEIHYAPKQGDWLIMAEIGLSVLAGRRLGGRVPDIETTRREVAAWKSDGDKPGRLYHGV
jgi:hypothetical protein